MTSDLLCKEKGTKKVVRLTYNVTTLQQYTLVSVLTGSTRYSEFGIRYYLLLITSLEYSSPVFICASTI